ncbi:HAD hydrolase-like protein [Brucepastera parasyntrophica]|uniref:HAD hydrolase-like protein n=1 Tax=Brucepastera parasyntrophica TaxID=2880008 RepID=UPI00210AB44D|nr:HAD hydrolase-like protein [Brucepastera parasyntrophica]ULQ60042.1 HAD hydrolase-like protein [Brucepastera parasyntrophica]
MNLKLKTINSYAVILAAGVGSRLKEITSVMPKSLIKVCGRSILDYQIAGYKRIGIPESNIIIITGYMAEKIVSFSAVNYPEVVLINSPDYQTTNNMYSLYIAFQYLEKKTGLNFDTLFINNADCLYDENLMLEFAGSSFDNAIATEIGEYIDESMKIHVDKNGKIKDISKKIPQMDSVGVSVDLYKYSNVASKELFKITKEFIEVKKDLKQWTEVAFPQLFSIVDVFPFDINHKKWVEVDTEEDLLLADMKFSSICLKDKKAFICDLDGTLFVGNKGIQESINFVNKNMKNYDFYFLTNNTSCVPSHYVKKLAEIGLPVNEEQIHTPLYPLIDYIKEKKYTSVYMVATEDVLLFMQKRLPNVSLLFDEDKNEAVVLSYDKELTYKKLENMSFLLNTKPNIDYVATHIDVVCPTEYGNIPDIGSMINMISLSTSREPNMSFGKPNKQFVDSIIENYGKASCVIAGDRIYTDGLLAKNVGVDFICVLSGETKRIDLALYNDGGENILIVKNLGMLTE